MFEVRGGDERSYPVSEVRGGRWEEIPHALKPEARGGGREELPHPPEPEARGGGRVNYRKQCLRTSLVVQWLRILLPMQGTWVRSLVGELRSHMPGSE